LEFALALLLGRPHKQAISCEAARQPGQFLVEDKLERGQRVLLRRVLARVPTMRFLALPWR